MTTAQFLDEIYTGPAWHGPSVKEALQGVTAVTAAQRLGPDRNSIWELVLHLAHGRHLLVERVNDAPSPAFPRRVRAPWWPGIDYEQSEDAWREDLALLDECHDRLLAAVRAATAAQLARVPAGSTQSVGDQLLGMAAHDAYHAGQIKLMALELGGSGSR